MGRIWGCVPLVLLVQPVPVVPFPLPVPTVAPRSLPTVWKPARIIRANRAASRFGKIGRSLPKISGRKCRSSSKYWALSDFASVMGVSDRVWPALPPVEAELHLGAFSSVTRLHVPWRMKAIFSPSASA